MIGIMPNKMNLKEILRLGKSMQVKESESFLEKN